MLTHVAFDFDGTLADSGRVVVETYNEIARSSGYGLLTEENIVAMRALSLRERCEALGVPWLMVPVMILRVGPKLRAAMEQIEFNPGVRELVLELRAMGLRMAIVSSNREENIRAFLRRHEVEGAFDAVMCSHHLFGKGALLRALMKREGVTAEAMAYVGDEERDVAASRAVNMRCVSVTWGFDDEARLTRARPALVARHPSEVAAWVRRERGDG